MLKLYHKNYILKENSKKNTQTDPLIPLLYKNWSTIMIQIYYML